ncbi:hypothetical protein LTR91_013503 [Friedmanniomyces endolithicus]|uniref:Uncharacterized protein n=1 Tax=Friedmanniomyces endolithicus TaxID=329885 RepID=A0AAN6QPE4_9PEZI|nr:hypothetical protein LTR94_022370 [Friedmanniomyces endolithicus]KAK0772634.1 hypothetical protein LTR75_017355 [Friedmanniomyces endolithicus]KAK0777879.1 hypothetical protein LTR59_013682 [Friedmanniomyces endolithicus]KAK0792068.1 hypothetical protein LTR38_010020 [Friedmanniomyces endolithicus]KAK0840819.1 hypothetical protein LTS02_017056 [Friedmanniomyces endolithicus]
MSSGQPNAWQSTKGSRPSNSASRTPQNRSGTASPSPQTTQSPRQDGGRQQQQQQSNSGTGGSNGPSKGEQQQAAMQDDRHIPANGFNAAEVRAALAREPAPAAYKPAEVSGSESGGGGAWGPKPNHMANNQPFFVQLAKQVATLEGGG